MDDREKGSFYSSLPDGVYPLADIPILKQQWLQSFSAAAANDDDDATVVIAFAPKATATNVSRPPLGPTQEIHVVVRGGKLVGVQVGDNEPITSFARSRDFEHKWIDN